VVKVVDANVSRQEFYFEWHVKFSGLSLNTMKIKENETLVDIVFTEILTK